DRKQSLDGSPRHGRSSLPVLLPRAPTDLPPAVRGPARLLRRGSPRGRGRRPVRLQADRPPSDDPTVSRPVPPGASPPLFVPDGRGRPPGQRRCEDRNGPERPAIADQRLLSLESGRRLQTRNAGIFLFLPLLAQVRFDGIVTQAGYPGSEMVSAPRALLALLTLKLLDKERRGHINDFNCDEALGLFAGLNILPKKSYATDYSYRTTRANQRALLEGWITALGEVMFPEADTFSVDFHPIPYRGDATGLDRHYIPRRGTAG